MADDLREILDVARREMSDVPDEVWDRFEQLMRLRFGAQKHYFAARRKSRALAAIEQAGDEDNSRVAEMLGMSVRRVQQLKKLR